MHSATLLLGAGILAAGLPQASGQQLKGVYEIPLRRINDDDAYGMDVELGTPPQKVTLLVDTGSNPYSIESPCGNNFEVMKFGYILGHYRNISLPLSALADLSLLCTVQYFNATRSSTQAMYETGYIKKRAYSVFLDGGGVVGQVVTSGNSLRTAGQVSVDFEYEGDDRKVLWDTGGPRWYAPEPIFWNVTEYFDLPTTIDRFDGRYAVNCKYRKPNDDKLELLNVRDDDKCYLDMEGIQGA
ncbi:Peptidase aspartic [Akanthomyces lecanii RCEF 1005]|uniref:Peptidase aspartic n=1 Tax=Akanthomyces lecanii RCEF 1005 TaxID=1081108 RepID=A0A167ZQ77_CORDF|nr:Peptidase aspartic [Akanthomyces lecanii RCEF 1005]